VVNDYITRLDEMIPPFNFNINFLISYLILNIVKQMPNKNKAPGQDRVTATMLKNSSFKIILQLYYIIKASM